MDKITHEHSPQMPHPNRVTTHKTNQESEYWAEFYRKHEFANGSSFFEFVNSIPNLPSTILDVGCGDGRDSFAFAHTGRHVVGLDRSEVGVKHALNKAEQEQLDDRLAFTVCDVSNQQDILEAIRAARMLSDNQSLCFYMRFFLHSIPEDVQVGLMSPIASATQEGDFFAAEFRTDKDEQQEKTFGSTHYRRYQNADKFSQLLKDDYGWNDIIFETESKGLSPYGDEDPVLYRVVAVKS